MRTLTVVLLALLPLPLFAQTINTGTITQVKTLTETPAAADQYSGRGQLVDVPRTQLKITTKAGVAVIQVCADVGFGSAAGPPANGLMYMLVSVDGTPANPLLVVFAQNTSMQEHCNTWSIPVTAGTHAVPTQWQSAAPTTAMYMWERAITIWAP